MIAPLYDVGVFDLDECVHMESAISLSQLGKIQRWLLEQYPGTYVDHRIHEPDEETGE